MKQRAFLPFAAGLVAGAVLTAVLVGGLPRVWGASAQFADVPAHAPAAPAVQSLKSEGVVQGYPDHKYHGSRPLTRYEAAVVLQRFVTYVEKGRQPLHDTSISIPDSRASAPAGHWAHDSQIALMHGRFLPTDSPVLQGPGSHPVTADQFADALSATVNRVSDRSLPPTPNADPGP